MADYPTSSDGLLGTIACNAIETDEKSAGGAAGRSNVNRGLLKRAIQGTVTAEMIRRASAPETMTDEAIGATWPAGDPSADACAGTSFEGHARRGGAAWHGDPWAMIVSRLTQDVLSPQEMRLDGIVAEIMAFDRPFLEVYRYVLMPLCACVRGRWSREESTFLDITLASGRIALLFNSVSQAYAERHLMTSDGEAINPGAAEARMLLARMPGDNHALGLQIVESVFRQSGWQVSRAGESGDLEACFGELQRDPFDLFGLSVGISAIAGDVATAVERARAASCNPDLKVCVGGAGVIAAPSVFDAVGADFLATDAAEGVELANAAVGFDA